MLGNNWNFDGTPLPTAKDEAITAKYLIQNVKWSRVNLQNSEIPRQDYHGVVSNPTLSRGRLITVEGKIFAQSRTDRGDTRNILDSLFQIESFPTQGGGSKILSFTDDDGENWFINAKVYRKPEYRHDSGNIYIDFAIDLFSQDGLIFSENEVSESGEIGLLGGMTLSTVLPHAMNGSINPFTAINSGNFASPVKITITGDIINPKITNVTTGRFFQINQTLTASGLDELIIDSENADVTFNGVSILSQRLQGSNWIFAIQGENEFVLEESVFDIENTDDATAEVSFHSIKL